MQKVIQEFTIGFFDSSGVYSIYVKQLDTNRSILFHFDDLGESYSQLLNDNKITITLRETLPNGNPIPDIPIPLSNIDKTALTLTVPVTADMTEQAGVAVCDLAFFNTQTQEILSTTRFKLIIEAAGGVPSGGKEKEWFDNWTELYISLKTLETDLTAEELLWNQNEDTRVTNENNRVSAENVRISHENIRVSAENIRIANETNRVSAENIRVTNEESRVSAEAAREAAEQVRESRVQEQVDEAHMWANGKADGLSVPSATNNAMFYAGQAMGASGIFNGTTAQWDALPETEKAKISTVILSDDNINSFITYKSNGGSGMMTVGLKTVGTPYVVRQCTFVPPADNYVFTVWNTNAEGTGVNYAPNDLYESDGNIDLYAQWEQR